MSLSVKYVKINMKNNIDHQFFSPVNDIAYIQKYSFLHYSSTSLSKYKLLGKISCMGYILATLRSMARASDNRIQQPACVGIILYRRGVPFLDFTSFKFILYSMGYKVLQNCTRKSAMAFRDFSNNYCTECVCSDLNSREYFTGFDSCSNSWIIAFRFFFGDASFCSTALWNAQALPSQGKSFKCQFITTSRSFVLLGNRVLSCSDSRAPAWGFLSTT